MIQKSRVVDTGEYTCLARNVLGEDTAVSTVIIMSEYLIGVSDAVCSAVAVAVAVVVGHTANVVLPMHRTH